MDLLLTLIDFILNIDVHLATFVEAYGGWVYGLLFLIIFVETGLVVMPFFARGLLVVCRGGHGG